MAQQSGGLGASIGRNTLLALLVIMLVLTLVGFAANTYVVSQNSARDDQYRDHAQQLATIVEQLGKNVSVIAKGNSAAVALVEDDVRQFDNHVGYLRDGDPVMALPPSPVDVNPQLVEVEDSWGELKSSVDVVRANVASLAFIDDVSGDLVITTSAIQQETERVVAAMVRAGAPGHEVALAQRQSYLIQRIMDTINTMLKMGNDDNLKGNFVRESERFSKVLGGLSRGDQELLLSATADPESRKSLTKIEELFRSVSGRFDEIATHAADAASLRQASNNVYAQSQQLHADIDGLIAAYQEISSQRLISSTTGFMMGAASFAIIVAIFFVISRQAASSLKLTEAQNETNQAAILQLLDELVDLADGDLRVQASVTESFTGAIADSINYSIDQMRVLVSKINETSEHVSAAAQETQESVGHLAESSEQQATEIADVSESVDDMAISIDRVSYNAAESFAVAERSVDIANNGAVVVQNTIGGMDKIRGQIQETSKRIKRLGESSQEIGDIVSLINDIADQTNILSLNAAIQASMAGDAGRGFAVVADEVQRLAERSGAAAKQITALVKTIQSDTNEAVISMEQTTTEVVQGTRLAQDAGVALGEIEEVSKSLAEIIENISDAARQQAASAGRISNTMKSIQEITNQTTEGTKSTATAVGNLATMTDELRSSVTGFKLPE